MKRAIEFDRNTMPLYGVLNKMSHYHYNDDINKKLKQFISHLEEHIYITANFYLMTFVLSQKNIIVLQYTKRFNHYACI